MLNLEMDNEIEAILDQGLQLVFHREVVSKNNQQEILMINLLSLAHKKVQTLLKMIMMISTKQLELHFAKILVHFQKKSKRPLEKNLAAALTVVQMVKILKQRKMNRTFSRNKLKGWKGNLQKKNSLNIMIIEQFTLFSF